MNPANPILSLRLLLIAITVLLLLSGGATKLHAAQDLRMGAVEVTNGAEFSDGNLRGLLAMPGHDAESGDPMLYRLVKYSGKFHILVIHFPIAFLLGACVCQWWNVKNGNGARVAMVMLWFGALGAVAAATLGWAYAYDSAYFGDSEKLLFWHRWLGTSTAVIALLTLLVKSKLGQVGLAIMLTVTAILVGLAGHFGGSLVYGSDHFSKF